MIAACTAALNGAEGRWLSVIISMASLAGIAVIFLRQRRIGYEIMYAAALLSFLIGTVQGMQEGTGAVPAVIMSLIGSMFLPLVTGAFLHFSHVRLG